MIQSCADVIRQEVAKGIVGHEQAVDRPTESRMAIRFGTADPMLHG